MIDALHVTWTNNERGCDTIEIERQRASKDGQITAPFAVVYTLPGSVDNKHDATANEDAVYTYRLRCHKGSLYSPYSNEVSANPKDV